ncbi:TMV resistance protein N-like [Quercus lobata]|uniref:TMV resistance protein N-like n=1 Tax=Quercus lobata TaxID=97700 RepID=UPI00124468A9|nr:TMV resistance protein N-like [Quercus lobata]
MRTQGISSSSSSSSSSTPRWNFRNFFVDIVFAVWRWIGVWIFRKNEELERGNCISQELIQEKEESSQGASMSSPSSSSTPQWKYEVFLSFRGVDTRRGFTDHLYAALQRKGILTFRDDEELERGKSISPELLKAIEESRFAIVIFSRNYAFSTWCLVELAHIVKCMRERKLMIWPIFYDVDPSDVRKQTGTFGQAFNDHEKRFKDNIKMVEMWRAALREVANLSGWHLQDREDSKMKGLPQLQQQLLADILGDQNIKIRNVYEGVDMIKKRLCHKKVLLVIDDVDRLDQLDKLAGEQDWFGLGSWIIITTRDEHVLVQHGVHKRYKPEVLNNEDASKLFCLKAFKMEQPKEGYMQLSQEVVNYANGLPLALVTLGSFLVGRTVDEWKSALKSFKKTKGDIFDILKISYDGLEEMWKEIFLDIACFFRRRKKDQVIQILENCDFDAIIGISVLVERSLLTVDDGEYLGMHDLLAEMGQKIIRFESGGNLGKQSRLWLTEDLLHVLKNNMATDEIRAIAVKYEEEHLNFEEFPEMFSKMSNLRLLIIKKPLRFGKLDSPKALNPGHLAIPNELRHLSWASCPLRCLASSFQPKELVQLGLPHGTFEYLWEGAMHSVKLKFIDLSFSENLIRTPDFSGVPRLEGLNLSCCDSLVEIHPSIGQLSRLQYLKLDSCESLTDLPSMSAEMQSLTLLDLSCCYNFSSILKFTGIMKSLSKIYLGAAAIKKLAPSSIQCLTALTLLDLSSCKNLECLPSNMDDLRSLETLILRGCKKLKSLPRLPSTLRFINAQCCFSLKPSPALVKLSSLSQPVFRWHPYDESGSGVAFTRLFRYLQGLLCLKTVCETSSKRKEDGSITEFQITIHGFEIPSWLTHQSVGNSISIELPSNWCNSKWMGFALCASVSACKGNRFGVGARVTALGDMTQNHYASELFNTFMHCEDSIWLLYLSRDDWFAAVGNGECRKIKVIFETYDSAFHVHECGVNLVYEQDVDEFSQTNAQCLIESFGKGFISEFTSNDHLKQPSSLARRKQTPITLINNE